jgi:hypothetical protein
LHEYIETDFLLRGAVIDRLDGIIAIIDAAIDGENAWQQQEFTESVRSYAGDYEFDEAASTFNVSAVAINAAENPLIAPGFGDL